MSTPPPASSVNNSQIMSLTNETPTTTPPGQASNTVTPTPDIQMEDAALIPKDESELQKTQLEDPETEDDKTETEIERSVTTNGIEEITTIVPEAIDEEDPDSEQLLQLTLPLSKIKRIFKLDPAYAGSSQNAVYATGLATELFVQYFVEQAALLAKMDKRKKIAYKDFSNAVAGHDALNFLADTVPKTQPIGELIQKNAVDIRKKVDSKAFKEGLIARKPTELGDEKPEPKKKKILAKGQQVLPFASEAVPVKKAGLDIMVIGEEPTQAGTEKGGEVRLCQIEHATTTEPTVVDQAKRDDDVVMVD